MKSTTSVKTQVIDPMKSSFIAIDPSINFCGYATFYKGQLVDQGLIKPPPIIDDWIEKAKSVFNQIISIKNNEHLDYIVSEIPEHWGTAGFLARESGSIFKLTFLCGILASYNNTVFITPSTWKKQLPKHVVQNRMDRIYTQLSIKKMNHNIVDAIGIGHFHIYGKI